MPKRAYEGSTITSSQERQTKKVFLFLQGPVSPFFAKIATHLLQQGHRVERINLCFGDWLFWRLPRSQVNAVNYRGCPSSWAHFIATFLAEKAVTHLLLLGEQREHHQVAIQAAKRLGIDVIVTDFGYIRPDWITFERNGMTGHSLFPRDAQEIFALAEQSPPLVKRPQYQGSFWNLATWDMLYNLSSSFLWFLYPGYHSHHVRHAFLTYLGTGWRMLWRAPRAARAERIRLRLKTQAKPYFVFPLQMEQDFSIRAYSDFPDLTSAIDQVIGSFTKHAPADSELVVKVHPLDSGWVSWMGVTGRIAEKYHVADRVHYIDGGSLADLVKDGQGVVTINSTVGVWALGFGSPVITLGQAVYDLPGLTFQDGLDRFWRDKTPPEEKLREAWLRAVAGCVQLRGVYYNQPGLNAAVKQAVYRLEHDLINKPMPTDWS